MDLMRWRPKRDFLDVFDELFKEWWNPSTYRVRPNLDTLCPAVDIYDNNNEVVLKMDLPGISKENIDITVENGVLTIAGEIKGEDEVKTEDYYKKERYTGKFTRSFSLDESINIEEINAKFENGVLTLTIPKPKSEEKKESKKVEIK